MSEEKPTQERIMDTQTGRPETESYEGRKNAVEKAKLAVEVSQKELQKLVEGYNEQFADKPFFGAPEAFEQTLTFNAEDPAKTIADIDAILDTPYKTEKTENVEHTVEYKLSKGDVPEEDRKAQKIALETLKEELKKFEEKLKLVPKTRETVEKRASELLVARARDISERKEKLSNLEKEPAYEAIRSQFEKAIAVPEFALLRPSAYDERAHTQLFMALMERETNGFKTGFPLDKMGSDPEQNKFSYPFIYKKWMEEKAPDGMNAIESARSTVKSLEGVTPITESIKGINRAKTENPQLAEVPSLTDPFASIRSAKGTPDHHRERITALKELDKQIDGIIRTLPTGEATFKTALEAFQEEAIAKHLKLEEAHLDLAVKLKGQREAETGFTAENLQTPAMRQKVLRWMAERFQEAVRIVDQPYGEQGGNWHRNLNPAVRRMMIATVFREGVARVDENDRIKTDIADEYKGMFIALKESNYFNREHRENLLDEEQRDVLIVARYAYLGQLISRAQREKIIDPLEELQAEFNKGAAKQDADKITRLQTALEAYNLTGITKENIAETISKESAKVEARKTLMKRCDEAIRSEDREAIRTLLNEIQKDSEDESLKTIIGDYAKDLQNVEITFNSLDHKERAKGDLLEAFGIKTEGAFEAFKEFTDPKAHPENADLNVESWDRLLNSPEGRDRLVDMLRKILPESDKPEGKEAFLAVLSRFKKGETPDSYLRGEDKGVAFSILKALQTEFRHREQVESATRVGDPEVMAKLEGMTFADKITDYGRNVLDMVMGPGQSPANRVAGIVMILGFLKLAKSAWKGDGTMGKMARALFGAGALELVAKQVTGQGILERFVGLDGLAQKLDGTYESVLLEEARDNKEFRESGVSDVEHAAALVELKDVPFVDLMDWYEATNPDGSPKNEKDRAAKLPLRIDTFNIVRGRTWKEQNEEGRARFVVRKTVENFFQLTAQKEQKTSAEAGKNMLKEIYVDPVKGEAGAEKTRQTATRKLPDSLLQRFRGNPKSLTWQTVLGMEIDPRKVEQLEKEGVVAKTREMLTAAGATMYQYTVENILHPAGEKAREFWKGISNETAPKIQGILRETTKAASRQITYYKDKVEVYFDNNKATIRRVAGEHWELVTETVKLPFQVLYAADQLVVPWSLTKLKQAKEIIDPSRVVNVKGEALTSADIIRSETADALAKGNLKEILDVKKNPEGKYFGMYQSAFLEAQIREGYFATGMEGDPTGLPPGIGYHISETTLDEAGASASESPTDQLAKMERKSFEEAKKMFRKKAPQLTDEQIDKYMYPIHMAKKMAGGKAEKLYVFWRMPLPDSAEFNAKEADEWLDYYDPNQLKDRPPFILDPSKGIMENLKSAFGAKSPAIRKGFNYATIAAAQVLRFYSGLSEAAGQVVAGGGELFLGRGKLEWVRDLTTMNQQNKRKIDEYLGSAGDESLALSDHYKKPANAVSYKTELENAITEKRDLDLSRLQSAGSRQKQNKRRQ